VEKKDSQIKGIVYTFSDSTKFSILCHWKEYKKKTIRCHTGKQIGNTKKKEERPAAILEANTKGVLLINLPHRCQLSGNRGLKTLSTACQSPTTQASNASLTGRTTGAGWCVHCEKCLAQPPHKNGGEKCAVVGIIPAAGLIVAGLCSGMCFLPLALEI
jgi:hypothetical protein